MANRRWAVAGTAASGSDSGTLEVGLTVGQVRVSVRPTSAATVYSTNVPIADIAAGSWEAWDKGAVTADSSDVVFGATAIKIAAAGGDCPYNLTGF